MKRKTVLLLLLLLAIGWLYYMAGCSLLGVSVDDRVMQFVSDINDSDRSQVYLNFHPDIFDWVGIQDPVFWNILSTGGIPYSISALVTNDPLDVTFTITDKDTLSWNVRFVMMKLGNDWMIFEMYMDVFPTAPTSLIVD